MSPYRDPERQREAMKLIMRKRRAKISVDETLEKK
jgi:hypothetical protein